MLTDQDQPLRASSQALLSCKRKQGTEDALAAMPGVDHAKQFFLFRAIATYIQVAYQFSIFVIEKIIRFFARGACPQPVEAHVEILVLVANLRKLLDFHEFPARQ